MTPWTTENRWAPHWRSKGRGRRVAPGGNLRGAFHFPTPNRSSKVYTMEPRVQDPIGFRQRGRDFEHIFEKMAMLQGMLARKVPLSCRVYQDQAGLTRYHPIDSELDWQVIDRGGRIAFVDTKSFQGDRFPRSAFNENQVRVASTMNRWRVRAGFCVWFRKHDRVVFFTGEQVESVTEGSLGPDDGTALGTGFDFALDRLFL